MRITFRKSVLKTLFSGVLCSALVCAMTVKAQASEPQRLSAVYNISFNNFELGTFKFWSEISNKRYSIMGQGKLTVLSGVLFEWQASTKSSGVFSKNGIEPKSFTFQYASNDKKENVDLRFVKNAVTEVVNDPPRENVGKIVPVSKGDLFGVYDPMSAIIAIMSANTKKSATGAQSCEMMLPVFDGKERYNLIFSHKKSVQMTPTGEKGYSGPAYICKVTYEPVSGHDLENKGTEFMAKTDEIEVWMVPVPNSDFYLPYHIVVPTPVGYASATTHSFQVEKPDGQVAFVN